MERQTTVTVQNIKNPAITRQMTVNSAKMNSRKWKIIESGAEEVVKKKEVVRVAEDKPVLQTNDDFGGGFAKIEASDSDKAKLQAEYEDKAGKKPDGRWNEAKLIEKIKELNTSTDETA